MLGFLLLVFTARIIKSVSYYFAEDHSISPLVENIGYAANLAIFPLLWFYLHLFMVKDRDFRWLKGGIHLLPSILVLFFSPALGPDFWLKQNGYTFSLIIMGAYIPFCLHIVKKNLQSISFIRQKWIISLTAGVTLVWLAYAANFFSGLVSYITGPVIFSFVIYYMSYMGLKHNSIFHQEDRYKNSSFTAMEIDQCFEKLDKLMETGMPYRDVKLTLPNLAKQLMVSPNLLSQTINQRTKMNFPDFINSYRVRYALELLNSPAHCTHKISAIAYDTGFNTLSAFNTAFRKFTQMTPSGFRKRSVQVKP